MSWLQKSLLVAVTTCGMYTHSAVAQQNPQTLLANQKSYFIENKGQYASDVKFLFRSGGMDMWITNHGVIYDLYKNEYLDSSGNPTNPFRRTDPTQHLEFPNYTVRRTGHVVRMDFQNASSASVVTGNGQQRGFYNYFLGNDSTKWVTNVHAFSGIRIENLYPNVDAIFSIDHGLPRYDLELRPGANPNAIAMEFEGPDKLSASDSGGLIIKTSMGYIEQTELHAYQMIDGKRHEIACNFRILSRTAVKFDIGAYDRMASVMIDPLLYSTYLSGFDDQEVASIAFDAFGEAIATGWTTSTGGPYPKDFPTTNGAYQTSNAGSTDAFLTKLNPAGSALVFSTYFGGRDFDAASCVAIDGAGDIYVTGSTGSGGFAPNGFPTTPGGFQTNNHGLYDAFLTEFNSNGTEILYSTYLGGSSNDEGNGIALGPEGTVYVTGSTTSTGIYPAGFPISLKAYQTTNNGGTDAFVFVISPQSSALLYSTYIGGASNDIANAIGVDSSGNAYITGYTTSTGPYPSGYPTTLGAFQLNNSGMSDAFVTKLNPAGTAIVYSTYLGGSSQDGANGIALDQLGEAFIAGYTASKSPDPNKFPTTPGAFQTSSNGDNDAFVAELNASGSSLVVSTCLGGNNSDVATSIALDAYNRIAISGYTNSSGVYPAGFPTTYDAFQNAANSGGDAFVTELDPMCSALLYSTYLGGASDDEAECIAIDGHGTLYTAGATSSQGVYPTGYPTTSGAFQPFPSPGKTNAFVSVIKTIPTIVTTQCNTVQALEVFQNATGKALVIDSVVVTRPLLLVKSSPLPILPNYDSLQITVQLHSDSSGEFLAYIKIYYHIRDSLRSSIVVIPLVASVSDKQELSYSLPQTLHGSLCDSLAEYFSIHNTGCDSLKVVSCRITGTDAIRFVVLSSFPFSISAGGAGQIQVGCTAKILGKYSCQLLLTCVSSNGTLFDTTLQLQAVIVPGESTFFSQGVRMTGTLCGSVAAQVTAGSMGCGSLEITGSHLSGSDSNLFVVLTKLPVQVSNNDSTHIEIQCTAGAVGVYRCSLILVYTSSDGAQHDTAISITVTIVPISPKLLASIDDIEMGNVPLCKFQDTTVTFRNIGCDTLRIDSLEGVLANGMSISGLKLPLLLPPDSIVTIQIHYQPAGLGALYEDLKYHSTEQGTTSEVEVIITGTAVKGTSALSIPDTTIDLGNVSVCSNTSEVITFASSGCDTLVLNGEALSGQNGFTLLDGHSGTIATGASDSVHVKFVPPATGQFSDDLTITSNGGTRTVHILATGVADPGKIVLSDTSLTFGTVTASCDSSAGAFRFVNTTCNIVTIDSVTARVTDGTSELPFGIRGGASGTLAPRDSMTFALSFVPWLAGTYSGLVTVYYHGLDNVEHDTSIALAGVAVAAPTIGVVMNPASYTAAALGTIDIPFYLTGSLDQTSSQSIGLQALNIVLAMNTDLLTPLTANSTIPNIPQIPVQITGKNSVTLDVTLPANFTFTDSTELLTLHCQAFITDTMQTAIALQSAVFGAKSASACFAQSPANGLSAFSLIARCEDSVLTGDLAHGLSFVVQSIVPNPTSGKLTINLTGPSDLWVLYDLYDLLGHSMMHGSLGGSANALDVSALGSGSYYLRLTSGGEVVSRRVVVRR